MMASAGAVHDAAGWQPQLAEAAGMSYAGLNFEGPLRPPPPGWAPWSAADLWEEVDTDAARMVAAMAIQSVEASAAAVAAAAANDPHAEVLVEAAADAAAMASSRLARRQAAVWAGSPLMVELAHRLRAVVVVGGIAFVHAHLDRKVVSPAWAGLSRSARRAAVDDALSRLNAAAAAVLAGAAAPDGPAAGSLFPVVWERSWATAPPTRRSGRRLDALLDALSATTLVVGHTPQPHGITPRYDGRVWCVDTGMSRGMGGGDPEALEWVRQEGGGAAGGPAAAADGAGGGGALGPRPCSLPGGGRLVRGGGETPPRGGRGAAAAAADAATIYQNGRLCPPFRAARARALGHGHGPHAVALRLCLSPPAPLSPLSFPSRRAPAAPAVPSPPRALPAPVGGPHPQQRSAGVRVPAPATATPLLPSPSFSSPAQSSPPPTAPPTAGTYMSRAGARRLGGG